ncbi:BRO family protein [Mycobacteroides abscessus]|nr:BRO family protein [Mycobacteroides abscessus]MDM2412041.1 BRO family protein [Mycobacteroides abscessus]
MTAQVENYESFKFEDTRIRVFAIDGRKLAVGADICAALDLKNSRHALARLDADDKLTISRSDTVGRSDGIWTGFAPQVQSVTLITENGATELILDSRKPEARRFRRWLTHTVWPSIRDTGSYSPMPAAVGLKSPITTEIDTAIEQLRLCRAARDLVPAAEFDRRVNHVLDRGLDMARDLSSAADDPLSPHQFLLDKGLPAFEAELFLSPFCEAVTKASRKLKLQAPQCEVAVLGKRVTQRSYEFTEAHRPAMETAWKSLKLPTPTAHGL